MIYPRLRIVSSPSRASSDARPAAALPPKPSAAGSFSDPGPAGFERWPCGFEFPPLKYATAFRVAQDNEIQVSDV